MVTLRPYQADTLRKVAAAFAQGYKRPCVAAACGAGKTCMFAAMAEIIQRKGKVVWFLVHRRELLDQTIATFDQFGVERKKIYIGMVATRHAEWPDPDTIIFDECHFSAAKTWQKIIEAYPKAYIIGLTATPARLDGKPLGSIYDTLIDTVQARELIEAGYLSPYKYYAPTVADLSALRRKGSDFDTEQAADILSERAVFGDVIKHYQTLASGKKAICYCATVKHSKAMSEAFKAAGIRAEHFDGDTPKAERKRIVEAFRAGEVQILCNVDLISVGFDCPDCECCILLRPTCSLALYIQQSNRALRYAPGKTAIILDHVGNVHRFGLPDDPREWSLDSRVKMPKEYNTDGTVTVRVCENCFSAYPGTLSKCPYCGKERALTRQEIKNIREIELQEIKERKAAEADKRVQVMKSAEECRTMAELQAYARKHGYSNGWVWHIAQSRGWRLGRKRT